MGKLVVTEFVSLDGVFEDPGGSESFEVTILTYTRTGNLRRTERRGRA